MRKGLSSLQKEVLKRLVKLYEENKRIVRSKEIADEMNISEGTVRVVLAKLKAIGLVEAKPGPHGGYVPTSKAYEVLSPLRDLENIYAIFKNDVTKIKKKVLKASMNLLTSGELELKIIAKNLKEEVQGKEVLIEGLGRKYLLADGIVIEASNSEIKIKVNKMIYTNLKNVGEIAKRSILALHGDMSFREAVQILHSKGVRGAPVLDRQGRVMGFMTVTDMALALVSGASPNEPIGRYVRKIIFSISESENIVEVIKVMSEYDVGRLVVVDSTGRPTGIITRTDIIKGFFDIKY